MADKLSVEIHGLAATLGKLQSLRRQSEGAFRGAVYMLATNVVSTSLKLAPADTGYLRASRYVRRPETSGTQFSCEVGYGAPYAIHVHEINKRYIVGEWKFLSRAWDWHAETAMRDLAAWTFKLLQGGLTIDNVPETHPRIWTGGERVVPKRKGAAKKKFLAQRVVDRQKNEARMANEARRDGEARQAGVRPPRPGRR